MACVVINLNSGRGQRDIIKCHTDNDLIVNWPQGNAGKRQDVLLGARPCLGSGETCERGAEGCRGMRSDQAGLQPRRETEVWKRNQGRLHAST